MNTVYTTLLADPGKEVVFPESDLSSLLGTFDGIAHELRSFQSYESFLTNCQITMSTLVELGKEGATHVDPQFSKLVGFESLEVVTMVKNAIKKIFQTLYDFLKKTLRFLESMVRRIVAIDSRLNDISQASVRALENKIRKNEGQRTVVVEELMRSKMILQMCPKDTFVRMIEDFRVISDAITKYVMHDVDAQITDLGKVRARKLLSKAISDSDTMGHILERLGIDIKGSKVTYKSPFAEYARTSMRDLQFTEMADILRVNKLYVEKVWTKTSIWADLISKVHSFESSLKKCERNLLNSDSIDSDILTDNVKTFQTEINFILHLISALRQFKTSLNYRRRTLCVTALEAYEVPLSENH